MCLMLLVRSTPRIQAITDAAVTFSDRYADYSGADLPITLHDNLSILGEQITARIELEDELLEAMAPA